MADVVIRPVQPGDADLLLANLRAADRAELDATVTPAFAALAVRASIGASLASWAAEVDGKLASVGGVTARSLLSGEGSPWLLGTPVMDANPGAVIRHSRAYIPPMLALFPHLVNHVDARNTRSIRWLRWLGFDIHAPEPFGPYGLPFHKFEMKA